MEDFFGQVVQAIQGGDWRLVAAIALIGIVAGLRWLASKLGGKVDSALNSDVGASLLVLAASYGTTLVAAHAAGQSWSWGLAKGAAGIAFAAAGGYSMAKRLLWPLWLKLKAKLGW